MERNGEIERKKREGRYGIHNRIKQKRKDRMMIYGTTVNGMR